MITLNGGDGGGTLWGTFYLAHRETDGRGFCNYEGLDYMVPPSSWYLPPPNSVWYPVGITPYGPRLTHLKVGDIMSRNDGLEKWNPCKHSTIKGDAIYSGPGGSNLPFWRKPSTTLKSSYIACTDDDVLPSLLPARPTIMVGRCATVSDMKVRSNTGALVSGGSSTLYGGDRRFYIDSVLCGNIAPPVLRSTLAAQGPLFKTDHWYAREINGNLATDPEYHIHWFRTSWSRPDRTTFVKDFKVEYHTPESYTLAASKAWTGHGCVIDANHRITTCVITRVRSDGPGQFQIEYDQTTELSWFGYSWPNYFSGNSKTTTRGLITTLLVLEPGLTASAITDSSKADSYCKLAKVRAAELYDHVDASSARTEAVRDLQSLDSNWIENLAGAKGTMEVINPLIEGSKAIKIGKVQSARKALAGAYLTYKYVVEPGLRDAKNLSEDGSRIFALATVNRFSNERRRGAVSRVGIPVCGTKATLGYFTTFHLRLKDEFFSQVWGALERLKIDPSAGQIWDCIPYSFVVDWFYPVGDSLRNLDAYNSFVLTRDLLVRIESFKVQWPLEEQTITDLFDGNICSSGKPLEYSWYDRRLYQTMGSVDPMAISQFDGLSVSQMAQSAALVTSHLG